MTLKDYIQQVLNTIKEIDKLRNKLRVAPNIDDFREYSFLIDELITYITQLEVEKWFMKEDLKKKEADKILEYKSWEKKMTVKEIEARVQKDLEKDRELLLKLDKYISLWKAKIQWANYFWKAVDSSLYHLNQREKQEILS